MHRTVFLFVLGGFAASSFGAPPKDNMNPIAEKYAHLVLALGQHDPDYVDAFYGPAEWKTRAEKEKKSLDQISAEGEALIAELKVKGEARNAKSYDEMVKLRREYLDKQIYALAVRAKTLQIADTKLTLRF